MKDLFASYTAEGELDLRATGLYQAQEHVGEPFGQGPQAQRAGLGTRTAAARRSSRFCAG